MLTLTTRKEEFLKSTLQQLESKTGVAHPRWSGWFNGKNEPKLGTLERLAEKFEMPLGEFVIAFVERRDRTMSGAPCYRTMSAAQRKSCLAS